MFKRRIVGTRVTDEHILVERGVRGTWLALGSLGLGAVLAALKCVIDAVAGALGP
jgi:hypothetical protein